MRSQFPSQYQIQLGKLQVTVPADPLGAVVAIVVVLGVLATIVISSMAAGAAATHLLQLL